jgi:hypothetical protein
MRRWVTVTAGVAVFAAALLGGALAWAQESSTTSASLTVSSAGLTAPANVTVTANCPPTGNQGDVLVTWSAAAYAKGYIVQRATGTGALVTVATVVAPTTSYDDTTVRGSTTYTYSVIATAGSWTSSPSSGAVTTTKHC